MSRNQLFGAIALFVVGCTVRDTPYRPLVDSSMEGDGAALEWGLPEYVLNINTANFDELTASANLDHRELYFARSDGANFDIWVSTRGSADELWSLATRVDALGQVGANEVHPELSPDGLELYLQLDNFIQRSRRTSLTSAWGAPQLVSTDGGASPSLTGDGLTMYYVGTGYSIKKTTRGSLSEPWGPEADAAIPGDPAYYGVSVSADELTLVLSSPMDLGLPRVIELSRATTSDPWGNLREVATLTALDPTPRDCDFFADANAMYCSLSDGSDYNVFIVRRE